MSQRIFSINLCFSILLFTACKPKARIDHDQFISRQLRLSKYLPTKKSLAIRDSSFLFRPARSFNDRSNDIRFELFLWDLGDCELSFYLVLKQPIGGDLQYGEQYQFIHFIDEVYPTIPRQLLESEKTIFNLDLKKAQQTLSIPDKNQFVRSLFESTLKAKPITASNLDSLFKELVFINKADKSELYQAVKQILSTEDTYCYSSVLDDEGIWKIQIIENQIRISLLNRKNMMCLSL